MIIMVTPSAHCVFSAEVRLTSSKQLFVQHHKNYKQPEVHNISSRNWDLGNELIAFRL